MKCRQDFVTNSSSSSFIFAFKDIEDYQEFCEYCDLYDYHAVYNLIENIKKSTNDLNEMRNKAISMVYNHYSYDIKNRMFSEMIPDYNSLDYRIRIKKEKILEANKDFQSSLMDETFKLTPCGSVLKKIDESSLVLEGMIWDTEGGLLEWAIRNDLLTSEFSRWCVLNFHIG